MGPQSNLFRSVGAVQAALPSTPSSSAGGEQTADLSFRDDMARNDRLPPLAAHPVSTRCRHSRTAYDGPMPRWRPWIALTVVLMTGCATAGIRGMGYVGTEATLQRLVAAAGQCGVRTSGIISVRNCANCQPGQIGVYIGRHARSGRRHSQQQCLFRWLRESREDIGSLIVVT